MHFEIPVQFRTEQSAAAICYNRVGCTYRNDVNNWYKNQHVSDDFTVQSRALCYKKAEYTELTENLAVS